MIDLKCGEINWFLEKKVGLINQNNIINNLTDSKILHIFKYFQFKFLFYF